jgi:3-oxoadipate CoA-transferase alpha subunit
MIDKRVAGVNEAVADIHDGATVMIGGFGEAGSPIELIHALIDQGAKDLIVVNNNTGSGEVGLAALIKAGRVSKMICSFPRTANSTVFPELYRSGRTALELVPQGTLAERIRAGGAGIVAFYSAWTTTLRHNAADFYDIFGPTKLSRKGQSVSVRYDKTLVYALLYNKTARNFSPLMATAATTTIVQAGSVVAPGEIDPETVITPGIFVHRVVQVSDPAHESVLVAEGVSYPCATSWDSPVTRWPVGRPSTFPTVPT